MKKRNFLWLLCLMLLLSCLPATGASADAGAEVWDGTVDISWYDPEASEYFLSTPAQLAGLAALVNGMTDPTCPRVIGDTSYLQSTPVEDYMLVGAGGGNVSDTVYTSGVDFAYKTVYLTADMDMGGVYDPAAGTWSGPNWTPIGGKFPMKPEEASGDCLTLDTRFNGVLDGQGHTISHLYCNRYAAKGFPYSMAVGLVGYLGGGSDTNPASTGQFADGWQPAVRNLVLGDGYILGRRMVGGIVGRVAETNNGVVVENCANRATVKSTDAKGVGGIVGSAWGKGVIRSCYNTGSIFTTYSSPAGGIVGTNEGMDIYNCYNAGTIDTNGQSRGRGIGSHSAGSYTVSNCYYLENTGDDASHPGYYVGLSKKITVSVTEVTAQTLKSVGMPALLNANGQVFTADTEGVNQGYPVLWYEQGQPGGSCQVELVQPSSGGSIQVKSSAFSYGSTVELAYTPEAGYTLEAFTVNGEALSAPFFVITGDVTVSASFKKLQTGSITIPESRDYYAAVLRSGYRPDGNGGMVYVSGEQLRSGDTVVEGNTLTVKLFGYTDASPEDVNLEYVEAFSCTLNGAVKNTDGSYTVSGGDVELLVSRKTQDKVWIRLADTGWYWQDSRRSDYTLTTPEELAGLAYLVNQEGLSFAGVTIRLGCDISLENTDGTTGVRYWTPIGANANSAFSGVFDGQGHAVYTLAAQSNSSYTALFGCCQGAEIRNLSVYGSVSSSAKASYAAGVAAYMNGGRIVNCENRCTVTAEGTHAGGIAAFLCGGAAVENCFNYGAVTAFSGAGGIAGVSDSGADSIQGCANFAPVTSTGSGTYGTGGIAGRLAGTVSLCVNYGDVNSADRYTGGVAGYTPAKNTSAVSDSANEGRVFSNNAMSNAATGGVVGYAQFLTLSHGENRGEVCVGEAYTSADVGAVTGRGGSVKELPSENGIPAYTPSQARTFPREEKDAYTIRFVAGDQVVELLTYTSPSQPLAEPPVPEKEGYTGYWDSYALGGGDLTVKALYRQKLVRGGDTITQDGTYYIAWFSAGEITVADHVRAVLIGSNGGSGGFEGLSLSVGRGAQLTLEDVALSGERTLLTLAEGSELTLRGSSRLLSRADADNGQPALRISGSVTINGSGELAIQAGLRNAAVLVDTPGSTVELQSGTLSVYKDSLLGFEGGAFWANGSRVVIRGGTFKGRTESDNVAVLSADSVSISGGRLLLQAEKCPSAISGSVTASGGSIAARGHSGNSAGVSRSYEGQEAIPDYQGTAVFEPLLPFTDLSVTDRCYDAAALCFEKGYLTGTSAGSFSPDSPMTRAMFVTVLYRMAGEPPVSAGHRFTDLTQDWYRDAVAWAVAEGITEGFSESSFSPQTALSTEQAVVFLYRYAQSRGADVSKRTDALSSAAFSSWACSECSWAAAAGLFDGVEDALAQPKDNARRGDLAILLANYLAQYGAN